MENGHTQLYEFGAFRLNPVEGLLVRDGKPIPLTPKAFETLVFLVRNAGHVLTKEELMTALWPDTFVEEGNLKVNISTLRKVLGDTRGEPAFIETVPRRGYRFVAPVRLIENGSRLLPVGSVHLTVERRRTITREDVVEMPEEPAPVVSGLAPAVPRERRAVMPSLPRLRRWILLATAAIVALVAAMGIGLHLANRPGSPVRVNLAGRKLRAWDARERLAWEYEFSEPMEIATLAGREGIVFADLRGDGHSDVLAPLTYASTSSAPDMPHGALFCFSERGELLWSYDPVVKYRFGGVEYGGPWALGAVTLVREGNGQGVWVAFDHRTWWPAFVAHINPNGVAEVRFLNAGRIWFLKELRTSTGTFLIAGGTNNEYRAASVAVIASDEEFALSPQKQDTAYSCADCGRHQVPFYLLFPRSEIFELQNQPFHVVEGLEVRDAGFEVRTFEGKDETLRPSLIDLMAFYRVSGNLRSISAAMGDTYWTVHRRLEREGKIRHPVEKCPDRKIAGRARIFSRLSGWYDLAEAERKAALSPSD